MFQSKDSRWKIILPKNYQLDLEGKPASFTYEDIVLRQGEPIPPNANLDKYLQQKWMKFTQEKRSIGHPEPENGPLVRLSRLPFLNDAQKIELYLAPTNYKEHIPSVFPDEHSRKLPFEKRSNVLNSIAVPVTIDEHLVYVERSSTATFPDELSGFGSPLHTPQEITSVGPAYLFTQVRDVVAKETGVSPSLLEVTLNGFAYLEDGFNVPLWIAKINLEKGDFENTFNEHNFNQPKKIRGSEELKYKRVGFVPLNADYYRAFLNRKDLARTVKPIWVYLAIQKFGIDYVKGI